MADTKQIASLKSRIAKQEADRSEWVDQLPEVEEAIEIETDQAKKTEWEGMKADILTTVAVHDKNLAHLRDELAALEVALPKVEPTVPMFDPEKHPLLKKATEKVEPAKPVTFSAGEMCEAQWTDRQWYKAKVQTVLGSASDPKYLVSFLDYKDSTLTVGRDAVRPIQDRKRKGDSAFSAPAAPAVSSPHVISGPASINPAAIAAKKETDASSNPAKKQRKIGGSKALERKENNWKQFLSKGPGKQIGKKDSMFRSGTSVNSRVGFTGSGSGMTEASKRIRAKYEEEEEEEDSVKAGTATARPAWRPTQKPPTPPRNTAYHPRY